MDYSAKYLTLLVLCLVLSEYEADDKYQTNLSRKRRYVVFPEGSTFSVSIARNRKYNPCNFHFNSKTVIIIHGARNHYVHVELEEQIFRMRQILI